MTSSLCFLLLCCVLWTSTSGFEIHSPRTTEWGRWHGWAHCNRGWYAAGIKIKYEGAQGGGDDTGLNAVSLYCLPLNWRSISLSNEIRSGLGAYGTWEAAKFCPRGQSIVGFQLRAEHEQQSGDDVAADNFRAFCGRPDGRRDSNNYIQGDTSGFGDWRAPQWCPEGYGVCGIDTQIEDPQGGGDDTSVNNVDLDCCEVS